MGGPRRPCAGSQSELYKYHKVFRTVKACAAGSVLQVIIARSAMHAIRMLTSSNFARNYAAEDLNMARMRIERISLLALFLACAIWAQSPKGPLPPASSPIAEQPDAQRT